MNLCACGCGEQVKSMWKRGHIGKTPEGKIKIAKGHAVENPFVCHKHQKRVSTTARRYRQKRVAEKTFHCDECGLIEWFDKKLSLVVDHIDGRCWNDILENLRLLCPNCASLLPTHGGKNKGIK
jgi:hypothetical protein